MDSFRVLRDTICNCLDELDVLEFVVIYKFEEIRRNITRIRLVHEIGDFFDTRIDFDLCTTNDMFSLVIIDSGDNSILRDNGEVYAEDAKKINSILCRWIINHWKDGSWQA